MNKARRWAAAWTAGAALNLALFTTVAFLISQAQTPTPIEVASVSLLVLEPKIPLPPPPATPPPPKPRPPLVKKIEPKPQEPQKVLEPPPEPVEPQPAPDTMGLNPDKEPEPPAPSPPPSAAPPPPEYYPSHKLTRLPAFIIRVDPRFPESERFGGREARVVVEVSLGPDGSVDSVVIIKSGGSTFDEAALQAIAASKFSPGYMDERPVAVRVRIPFVFKLK